MSIRVPKSEAPEPISPDRRPLTAVPKAPAQLDGIERRWWRVLWRTPVAATWTASDEPLLVTLVRLYALSEEAMSPGVAGQISAISSQLGLNPRSRAQLRIEFSEGAKVAPLSGRERFRAVG